MDRMATSAQSRRVPAGRLLLLLAAITAVAVLFVCNPATSGFYPFCPLHRLTGLLCPGCGSLRALHELLHGNVAVAFQLNSLLVISLPVLGVFAARWLYQKFRGQPVARGISARTFWTGFVIVVLFGVFRNL